MLHFLPLLFSLFLFLLLANHFIQIGAQPPAAEFMMTSPHCEMFPGDPICGGGGINDLPPFGAQQQMPFSNQNNNNQQQQQGEQRQNCNYQDLWLIPGRADASCTRPSPRRLAEIDAKQVRIYPPIVKFPGCFTVEIKNVRILDPADKEGAGLPSSSIFAKSEFQWLNVRGSGDTKCQNASLDGCGGFGNNCYYCDICESLKAVDKRPEQSGIPGGIAEQLRGMNCPTESGFYTFRKKFCFNDWHTLDNDGDCRPDFMTAFDDQSGLRSAMAALQQVGYGTVVAKVRLAYNATPEIARKKALKEAQIERSALREMEQQQRRLAGGLSAADELASSSRGRWHAAQRKGSWHRDEYLPWLLYENEIACIRLTFDVCERPPQQRMDASGGYTCI